MKPFPDMEWIGGVCRIGQREACCRYLTMGAAGWNCEKLTALRATIDRKVAAGEFTAQGDNCEGVER